MGAFLSRVVLGACIAMAAVGLIGPGIGEAQPGPVNPAPADASTQAAAKKLVADGNTAYGARDYDRAISLYLKAFSLVPHPILLFNIAQAHRFAGCPRRAVPFYERYLAQEPGGAEAGPARAALAEVKAASGPDKASCAKASADDAAASAAVDAARPMGRLKLSSTPSGVEVRLDGEKVGVTPLERDVTAGIHSITLVDRGRLAGERRVEVGAGAVVEVAMPVEASLEEPRRRSRVVPIALFAAGGVAIGGGILGLYLGQKGGHEDRYVYRGATPLGVAGLIAGTAALGVGLWLWPRGPRESAPVATISPAGGYLGWQGRF